jgi:tetratricopeptide (TPR) repeat protein
MAPTFVVQNKKEKAELLYLRGKALDFLPEYSKNAEECLSKAIKLMPTNARAWDALGHVYWKKASLVESRKCFEGSLEQDEDNIEVLRNLSMVCRQIQEPNDEQRRKNYLLSIQLANKCVTLDMKDSQSWCKCSYLK